MKYKIDIFLDTLSDNEILEIKNLIEKLNIKVFIPKNTRILDASFITIYKSLKQKEIEEIKSIKNVMYLFDYNLNKSL